MSTEAIVVILAGAGLIFGLADLGRSHLADLDGWGVTLVAAAVLYMVLR